MNKVTAVTSDSILQQYRKLNATPSGSKHVIEVEKLEEMVIDNQDQLYELVFSGKVTDEISLHELIFFAHGKSTAKRDNVHWIPFLTRVRERISELPETIQSTFKWLEEHYYWDEEPKVNGKIEVRRLHRDKLISITVYDDKQSSISFVTDSYGVREWIAALSSDIRSGSSSLIQDGSIARITRLDDGYQVVCYIDLAPQYKVVNLFTIEQAKQIVNELKGQAES